MTGIEMLREWANELREVARAYRDREIDYVPIDVEACQRKNAAKLDAIADQIERETLPRPRFEDGEPVQWGDEYESCGDVGKVDHIELTQGGWMVWSSGHAVAISSACDFFLKRPEPPKVLDADGVEIKVGDEVWDIGREQHAYKVLEPKSGDEYARGRFTAKCVDLTYGELVVYADPSSLTHRSPEPPDSWEKLDADVKKRPCEYFGFTPSEVTESVCKKCPANEAYSCWSAITLDIVRRCKRLAGVE